MKTILILFKFLVFNIIFTATVANGFGQAITSEVATEEDHYKMITLPIPEGIELEVGGLASLPNGTLAVSTRRGDVYIVENPYMLNGGMPYYRKFASGLHEILGLAYKDGAFYMAQRGELTKLTDKDRDGKADVYETVYAWPLSAHYHEYSYGPIIMPNGNMIVTGNVAFGDVEWWRGESRVPWRGWTMEITPEGEMMPYATGMRSPCGIGLVDGEFFYADNQGDWMGSGGVIHLEKGDFTGHPAGLRWTSRPESPVKITTEDIYSRVDSRIAKPGEKPVKPEDVPEEAGRPLYEIAEELPALKLPAVWLPHAVLGISTSAIQQIPKDEKFGPFGGQLLVGDQGQSKIARVFLEKVNGEYQGAAFLFREGFQSGVLRMEWGKDGSLFVGQTNRGWGSAGDKAYGLQRLVYSGKTPFEMKAVRAMPDGFEIEFTQPVDKAIASNPESYQITGFIYKYHPVYGSPAINDKNCFIQAVEVSDDGLKARLVVDNLREKYIHEIRAASIRSANNESLLHSTTYYTLNNLPQGEKLVVNRRVAPDHTAHAVSESTAKSKKRKKTTETKSGITSKNQVTKPASWEKVDQTIVLGTLPGLKFDLEAIKVKAGSKVMLTFNNNDDMPHNCVIVLPGQAQVVGDAAFNLGIKGAELHYAPDTPDLLFHTRLLQPGASETIYFEAPSQPGNYTYVCTVPGHYFVMTGTMTVTEN
ncbi:hypothetical protein BH23BAC1_BH23BAC1_18210 [soil metagenome]